MTATLMEMARAERTDMLAFLTTLTPEDWETPSLCARWTVKDVVAHVISYEELGFAGLLRRAARGWGVAGRVGWGGRVGGGDSARGDRLLRPPCPRGGADRGLRRQDRAGRRDDPPPGHRAHTATSPQGPRRSPRSRPGPGARQSAAG